MQDIHCGGKSGMKNAVVTWEHNRCSHMQKYMMDLPTV